ncbi:MAG: hypothetical protein KAU49_05080 [Candidatus Krumholzibacteria bacterium]|nr:hypothetical protein [Candidatus Krumholzibacteria bacterium]
MSKLRAKKRGLALAASMLAAAALLAAGCDNPDTISSEKAKNLTPDERYLVQLYLKINDLERNLQENPVDSARKWDELKASVDTARVKQAIAVLEEDPKRWLGVYTRINDLMFDTKP